MEPPKFVIPEGYKGHVPDSITKEDQGYHRVISTGFEAPVILSNYELDKQLGEGGSSINPLWFLVNPFKLPCAKRALIFGTTIGSVIAMSTHLRSKAIHIVISNFGLGFGAGSIMSLLHCKKVYNEQLKYNPLSISSRMEFAKSPDEYVENALKTGATETQIDQIKKFVGSRT